MTGFPDVRSVTWKVPWRVIRRDLAPRGFKRPQDPWQYETVDAVDSIAAEVKVAAEKATLLHLSFTDIEIGKVQRVEADGAVKGRRSGV